MAFYESVFIARQDISATQVEGLTDTFTQIIEKRALFMDSIEAFSLFTA